MLLQSPCHAQADSSSLPAEAASEGLDEDVVVVFHRERSHWLDGLDPMKGLSVEILHGILAVDNELALSLDNPHDGACDLAAPDALPVLHLVAVNLHVPVPVRGAAVAPLGAGWRGLQGTPVELGVQWELESLDHGHLLVDWPSVRLVAIACHLRLQVIRHLLRNGHFLVPGVDVVLLARLRILRADLHGATSHGAAGAPIVRARSAAASNAQHQQGSNARSTGTNSSSPACGYCGRFHRRHIPSHGALQCLWGRRELQTSQWSSAEAVRSSNGSHEGHRSHRAHRARPLERPDGPAGPY
mmetsp:Transcript_15382/g.33837  ORF Transcript_15382/g.33837 Transcript_15382/m.33837 type:complete len:300 (-) Transcript_15382:23-922(-)